MALAPKSPLRIAAGLCVSRPELSGCLADGTRNWHWITNSTDYEEVIQKMRRLYLNGDGRFEVLKHIKHIK